MARFGNLRESDLTPYATVLRFRDKPALTNTTFPNASFMSHNHVMKQARLIYPWNWGKHRHRRMKETTVKCRLFQPSTERPRAQQRFSWSSELYDHLEYKIVALGNNRPYRSV